MMILVNDMLFSLSEDTNVFRTFMFK
jgi:hypothetical protein